MSNTIKNYLAGYNFVAFVFWLLFLISFTCRGCVLTSQSLWLLNIAQGLALLEIIHALLRWVKSPVGSTAAQVFSRILVLVLINIFVKKELHPITNYGIITVAFAWGITELIRYSYYFFSLVHREVKSLVWMRYSFFIVLYPLGVTGEWLIIITPLITDGFVLNFYTAMVVVLAISYLYYFPVLYKYMWKHRKVKLNNENYA
jgi:very-long-chain (3R)-3-hydroxyacyl-CoA dehydratase